MAKPENRTEAGKRKLPDAAKPFQFKPGQSGNPGGRPKAVFSEAMQQHITLAQAAKIVQAVMRKAAKGDVKAFESLASRLEGKPIEQVRIEGQMQVSVTVDL